MLLDEDDYINFLKKVKKQESIPSKFVDTPKLQYARKWVRLVLADDWLPKCEMCTGKTYLCKARNFREGTWNGQSFDYTRYKWGAEFTDQEFHFDDGPPHGTVKPFIEIEGHMIDSKEYQEGNGMRCPHCQSEDIDVHEADYPFPLCILTMHCVNCGKSWKEEYKFVKFVEEEK